MTYFVDLNQEISSNKKIMSRNQFFWKKGIIEANYKKLIFSPNNQFSWHIEITEKKLEIKIPKILFNIVRPRVELGIKTLLIDLLKIIFMPFISLILNLKYRIDDKSKIIWFNFSKLSFWKTKSKSISEITEKGLIQLYRKKVTKEENIIKIFKHLSKYNLSPETYFVTYWRDYSESTSIFTTLNEYSLWQMDKKIGKKSLLFIGPLIPKLIIEFYQQVKALNLSNFVYLISDLKELDLNCIVSASAGFVPFIDDRNFHEKVEAKLMGVPIIDINNE